MGNRATESLLSPGPTEGGGSPVPSLELDPMPMLFKQMVEDEGRIRSWLDEHTEELRGLSLRALIRRVRDSVPEAERVSDVQIKVVSQDWAASHGIDVPGISARLLPGGAEGPAPASQPAIGDSEMIDAVRGAFTTATEGVEVRRGPWGLSLSASGLTADLQGAGQRAAIRLGSTGSVGFATEFGNVHFNGAISMTRWELTLSFPSAAPAPDLSRLEEIFERGEEALRAIVDAAVASPGGSERDAFREAIEPHSTRIRDAVEAVARIAQVPPDVSFGITVGGPSPGAKGSPGAPQGVTINATFTIRF